MERTEAVQKLQQLVGKELHQLANEYEVTIYRNGKVNKGWAGHVFERFLELPINSAQSPNFGSWELKSIPLKTLKNGSLSFKETMAVTMIDSVNVCQKEFKDSHLLAKLKKLSLLQEQSVIMLMIQVTFILLWNLTNSVYPPPHPNLLHPLPLLAADKPRWTEPAEM